MRAQGPLKPTFQDTTQHHTVLCPTVYSSVALERALVHVRKTIVIMNALVDTFWRCLEAPHGQSSGGPRLADKTDKGGVRVPGDFKWMVAFLRQTA